MHFANALAWVGLLSVPVIILMYLLKQKHVEVTVPSLFLWRQVLNLSQAQRPWQKLRRNLLMFLQILLAVLFVFALANPYRASVAAVDKMVLVLDNSLSMQATDAAPSRHAQAQAEMIALVESAGTGTRFTVMTAGAAPALVVNDSDDPRLVIDRIRAITPSYTPIDLAAARALLHMLAENMTGSGIFVFSDKYLDFGDLPRQDNRVGGSVDNMAITNMAYNVDGDRVILLVQVRNFGASRAENSVAVFVDGFFHDVREITAEAGETVDVFFTGIPREHFRAQNLEARLTHMGYLAADSVAFAVVAEPSVQPVMLVTAQNFFLESILNLLPNVALYRAAPSGLDGGDIAAGYTVYVFDGVLPEILPEDGHLLIFNPPVGNAFIQTADAIPVSAFVHADHALLHLGLTNDLDFAVARSKVLTTPGWGFPVLSTPETPLIIQGERGAQRIVVIGFDLHDTDLPLRADFPLFMHNVMQFFIPGSVTGGAQAQTGRPVGLNVAPNATRIRVATPRDDMVTVAPPFPAAPFADTAVPGFYTLVQETAHGTFAETFAVNVPTTESNLLRDAPPLDVLPMPLYGGVGLPLTRQNFMGILLLPVLILLLTEWWVFGRGR